MCKQLYIYIYILQQILIQNDQPETELLWITSGLSEIPFAAIVASHKADNRPLYVAQIQYSGSDWRAGSYDPDKQCAEYLIYYDGSFKIKCGDVWKLLIVKYGKF